MSKLKYQDRDEVLSFAIIGRRKATSWEFLRIAAWKSALNLAQVSVNNPKDIEDAMEKLLDRLVTYKGVDVVQNFDSIDWDVWQEDAFWMLNRTGLIDLSGVGYAMFTGILGYLLPNAFPVMDKYSIAGIFGWDVADRRDTWYQTPVYRAYAEHLASLKLSDWSEKNIHERDKAVMSEMQGLKKSRGACTIDGVGGLVLPTTK